MHNDPVACKVTLDHVTSPQRNLSREARTELPLLLYEHARLASCCTSFEGQACPHPRFIQCGTEIKPHRLGWCPDGPSISSEWVCQRSLLCVRSILKYTQSDGALPPHLTFLSCFSARGFMSQWQLWMVAKGHLLVLETQRNNETIVLVFCKVRQVFHLTFSTELLLDWCKMTSKYKFLVLSVN